MYRRLWLPLSIVDSARESIEVRQKTFPIILDGDLLAVHRTAEARSGQIVVARLEDEVTVKRLQRRGSRVELIAENPDYAPIVVNGPLAIEGLVVGLIRGGRAW